MRVISVLALVAAVSLSPCFAEGRKSLSSPVAASSRFNDHRNNNNKKHVWVGATEKYYTQFDPLQLRCGATTSFRTPPRPVRSPLEKTAAGKKTTGTSQTVQTKETIDAFLTRDSRNSFISRVYAILAGQMVVTGLSIYLFGKYNWLGDWMSRPGGWGAAVPGISLLLSTVAWYIMFVSDKAKRSSPLKWQILSLFTLGEAVSVGFLTSFFKFESVLVSMLTTAASTLAVSYYTIANRNSQRDLSTWGATLSQAGLIFLGLGLIQLLEILHVLPKGFLPISDKVTSFLGSTLFSAYLAHHTRQIVAGKNTEYKMNEKDYVYAAMTLYNDIINIFVYILKILGQEHDHDHGHDDDHH